MGNGKVTVKKKATDRGESVRFTAGDRLVVCLDVTTAVAAKTQLLLRAHVDAGDNIECGDGDGDGGGVGVALHIVADLAVEPGFEVDAKLTASAFAHAGAGENVEVAEVTGLEPGLNNDPDDPNGLAPAAVAAADYCKTVTLGNVPPDVHDPDSDADGDGDGDGDRKRKGKGKESGEGNRKSNGNGKGKANGNAPNEMGRG